MLQSPRPVRINKKIHNGRLVALCKNRPSQACKGRFQFSRAIAARGKVQAFNTPSLRSVGIPETTNGKAVPLIAVVAEHIRIVATQESEPSIGTTRRGTPPIAVGPSEGEGSIWPPETARQPRKTTRVTAIARGEPSRGSFHLCALVGAPETYCVSLTLRHTQSHLQRLPLIIRGNMPTRRTQTRRTFDSIPIVQAAVVSEICCAVAVVNGLSAFCCSRPRCVVQSARNRRTVAVLIAA